MDKATPTASARWVRHRVEEVIGQLSTVLDDDEIEDMVQAFKRNELLIGALISRRVQSRHVQRWQPQQQEDRGEYPM